MPDESTVDRELDVVAIIERTEELRVTAELDAGREVDEVKLSRASRSVSPSVSIECRSRSNPAISEVLISTEKRSKLSNERINIWPPGSIYKHDYGIFAFTTLRSRVQFL